MSGYVNGMPMTAIGHFHTQAKKNLDEFYMTASELQKNGNTTHE